MFVGLFLSVCRFHAVFFSGYIKEVEVKFKSKAVVISYELNYDKTNKIKKSTIMRFINNNTYT